MANESLQIFKSEKTLANAATIARLLQKAMPDLLDMPFVGDVRQIGTILAIELVKNKKTKQGFSFEERIGLRIYNAGLKRNLILRPLGNIIYLYLPLSTKESEVKYILSATYDSIWEGMKNNGY